MRTAEVAYYFDADLLGLAHVVSGLRLDCTYPGDPGIMLKRQRRPPCDVTDPATKDHLWIPRVAAHGWIAITRDSDVRAHPRTMTAVAEHGARLIVLHGRSAATKWQQLEVLMSNWRDIEGLRSRPGPWLFVASRTALREVPLPASRP